jgi:DNA polymerase III delta prime subunit
MPATDAEMVDPEEHGHEEHGDAVGCPGGDGDAEAGDGITASAGVGSESEDEEKKGPVVVQRPGREGEATNAANKPWRNKYRPQTLDRLSYDDEVTEQLTDIAASGHVLNMLFYGPRGAGKTTRIHAFLHKVYGSSATIVKSEHRTLVDPQRKQVAGADQADTEDGPRVSHASTTRVAVGVSNYHTWVRLADVEPAGHWLVIKYIKEIAEVSTLGPPKVVVVPDVDFLPMWTQRALGAVMGICAKTSRFIISCEKASKISSSLLGLCVPIRVHSPTPGKIVDVLAHVADKAGFDIPSDVLLGIAELCDGDVGKAIDMLQDFLGSPARGKGADGATGHDRAIAADAAKEADCAEGEAVVEGDNTANDDAEGDPTLRTLLPADPLEKVIDEVACMILKDQSLQMAKVVSSRLEGLMSYGCAPIDLILKTLLLKLISETSADELHLQATASAAELSRKVADGADPFCCLNGFILRFMADYEVHAAAQNDIEMKDDGHTIINSSVTEVGRAINAKGC